MGKYYLDDEGRFIVEEYNREYPFSNFLPAISGVWGIPSWAFFVNRGQGIVSMGVKDKDNSILEFLPANRAYQSAPVLGFRTFVKFRDGKIYEPYRLHYSSSPRQKMIITSHDLSLEETGASCGLEFRVNYFTLPNMPFGALVRCLSIKNVSGRKLKFDLLDGLPKVIPFGSRDIFLKFLSRTLEAWMTSDIKTIYDKETALFKLSVDPEDVASTQHIEGVNFSTAFFQDKEDIVSSQMIVDPSLIFGADTSFETPLKFAGNDFSLSEKQVMCGKTPCSFSFSQFSLAAGEEKTLFTVTGGMLHADMLKSNLKPLSPQFILEKKEENKDLVEGLKENAWCASDSYEFNEYISCSYLDNILRGGYPYISHDKHSYYVFSRKHGDLERDYNKFNFLPSYFSQGEANYRDINQNRRNDVFFTPSIEDKNIVSFMNLLRLDGYNPLLVQGEKYYFQEETVIEEVLKKAGISSDPEIIAMMKNGFYLGEIFGLLERKQIRIRNREKVVNLFMDQARCEQQAEFGEGFWIDHWFYNLDLIEGFLYFYPDRKQELFFEKELLFWDDSFRVKPRSLRYVEENGRIMQLNAVEEVPEKKKLLSEDVKFSNFLRTKKGKGELYTANLMEKMLALLLNKLATLDFQGIGIEMEAGKPGWCDSLNGLPALFGSSLCETVELRRLAAMMRDIAEEFKIVREQVVFCEELDEFLSQIEILLQNYLKSSSPDKDMWWWEKANTLKEQFREKVFWGISGKQKKISLESLSRILDMVLTKLDAGIKRAQDKDSGVCYTYFYYEIVKYMRDSQGKIKPEKVKAVPLPLFLEGPMHALRLGKDPKELHARVKKSRLFDKKLKMYRLNTCLENTPFEIGRSRAFPRGWLENESIWLHMEYKYILELIKNGMYDEFFKNLYNCSVCFLDPKVYGRSILENSSFLASSAYPDNGLWGKGFVARLTGATSEILSIYIYMCLGKEPFFLDQSGALCARFRPLLQERFFTARAHTFTFKGKKRKFPANTFAFKLFSKTLVVYHNPQRKNTYASGMQAEKIEVLRKGEKINIRGGVLSSALTSDLREEKIDEIHVYFS